MNTDLPHDTGASNPIARIGHNNPPNTPETLLPYLQEINQELTERQKECLAKAAETPEICDTDDMESIITDRIGAIQKCVKELEAKRVDEKKPYLSLERAVDGFFNPLISKLDEAKKKLSRIGGAYQAEKAEKARQAARELAEAQRKEKERLEAEARESERIAREAREAADKIRRDAEAEQDRVKKAAAETAAKELEKQAKASDKSATQSLNQAVRVEKQENKAIAQAEGKPSKLVASHGTYGARGSLRVSWKGKITDRSAINPAVLFPFIGDDALQVALNRYIDANCKGEDEPKLAGAKFWRDENMQVRA